MLDGEPLFQLTTAPRATSVEERAARISQKLEAIANDSSIQTDRINLTQTEFGTAVYAEDIIILAVDDTDVVGSGLTPRTQAQQYRDIIQTKINQYREERSAEYLTRAAITTLLCTLGLMVAIVVLANVMPQFYRWLDHQQDRWVPNIRIQNIELLSASQLTGVVQLLTQILHFLLVSTLLLFYLSYVLGLFPRTQYLGEGVWGYLGNALQKVWNNFGLFLPNLLTIALIILLTNVVLRFARWIFANIRRERLRIEGFYPEWAIPTYRLVQFFVIAFATAVIFPYLPGASSPAFQGVSIFFGLLVSLGAGGAIFSLVSGFILVYTRAFVEGDRIHFDDIEGFVEEKSLFVTRIRTIENTLVSIPNTALLTGKILNYTALIRESEIPLIVTTTVTLGYDAPWKLVHETLIAAANANSYILSDPPPFIWQTSLDDFYVSYQLRAYTTYPEALGEIYSELHQNVQDFCNKAGIEILSPHYGAMRDGNHTTIPTDYLPADYVAPPWTIAAGLTPNSKDSNPQQQP
jgi:small-conductance mechanosensitive channel